MLPGFRLHSAARIFSSSVFFEFSDLVQFIHIMAFNEDSRVKVPAILHLTRLGYSYLSLKNSKWDESTNIFPDLLRQSLQRINPDASSDEITRTLQEITLLLDHEDLGKAFHERLLRADGVRIIDFEDFQ